jgi:hypothetical protein
MAKDPSIRAAYQARVAEFKKAESKA